MFPFDKCFLKLQASIVSLAVSTKAYLINCLLIQHNRFDKYSNYILIMIPYFCLSHLYPVSDLQNLIRCRFHYTHLNRFRWGYRSCHIPNYRSGIQRPAHDIGSRSGDASDKVNMSNDRGHIFPFVEAKYSEAVIPMASRDYELSIRGHHKQVWGEVQTRSKGGG